MRSSLSPNSASSTNSSSTSSSHSMHHLDVNTTATAGLNPFVQRHVIKTKKIKRQQGSSRFISQMGKELEPLPLIKGNQFVQMTFSFMISNEKNYYRRTCSWTARFVHKKAEAVLYCVWFHGSGDRLEKQGNKTRLPQRNCGLHKRDQELSEWVGLSGNNRHGVV